MIEKDQAEKLIRKVLPTFRISGEVGRGAFGSVYKIKDELKERAAKIIPLHASAGIENGVVVSSEAKIERDFRHIVDSYERIACDEIVTVYDFYMVKNEEEATGGMYALTVMEMYPTNLSGYVIGHYEKTGGPLDVAVASKIIDKVALMLGNLYSKMGFLFEDFKPENILIKEHMGDLKLVVGDIGGLKNVVSIALTGSQVTPIYCAPEVIRKAQVPNLRSIVYSFGLLCYFILEGHLPYDDKGVSARLDLIREKGVPYGRRDIPDILKRVIEKCLAFDAERRFSDFDEVRSALSGRMPIETPDAFSGETVVVAKPSSSAPPSAPVANDFSASTINVPTPGASQSGAIAAESSKSMTIGKRPAIARQAPESAAKTSMGSVSIMGEKEEISKIQTEIKGKVIKAGEAFKISNESCRVTGNLLVEKGAVLSVVNSKLFFGEGCGIIAVGAVRAKDSVFSALDAARKWTNLTIYSMAGSGVSVLENCKIHFGNGISGKSLMETFNITRPAIHQGGSYGGGLFVAGGMEKTVVIKHLTCYKCAAQDGGGMYFHKSKVPVENCLFEGCTAKGSGGGMSIFESEQPLIKCTFSNCTAGKDGGGLHLLNSNSKVDDSMFQSCLSKYSGGGIACLESNPVIKNCKFDRCASAKAGGGIYIDKLSKPQIAFPSYSKCRPNDTNL